MRAWLDQLAGELGPGSILTGEAAREKASNRWSRVGIPLAVARPRSTAEVSSILRAAHAARQTVVPWGGLTGLVDGAYAQDAVAISMERMNRIEALDTVDRTMTVQAGCVLQIACEAAEAQDLFLPLDNGARGSATIGGNVSTNAGGNRVLRWGMTRESVLGLEAVLADGTVVDSMNALIKNNAGYDLKHLFVGAEGTLGIVTRVVLRLRPRPASQNTAYLAVGRFEDLARILNRASGELGGILSAFEVMWSDCYELLTSPPAAGRPILPYGYPYYVLIETLGSDPGSDAARFEEVLGRALEEGEIADAVIAKSAAERAAMWAIRDDVGQVARNGPVFTFDVSLKIRDMERYVIEIRAALEGRWGGAYTLMVYGHLGDGNLHLAIGVGSKSREAQRDVEALVYAPLQSIGGSFSAEHGVGLQKREYLPVFRSLAEIEVMRSLKASLDPFNILNPDKVLLRLT